MEGWILNPLCSFWLAFKMLNDTGFLVSSLAPWPCSDMEMLEGPAGVYEVVLVPLGRVFLYP